MPSISHVTFTAAGACPLRLEGMLHYPEPQPGPLGACVVLHPHPAFRGSMDAWLLSRIAARLADEGWITLRFNFRGVGASEGKSGDGTEEALDVLGALTFLDGLAVQESGGVARRVVVGWGFGALVGLLLTGYQITISDWVGIGPPTRRLNAIPMAAPPYRALPSWPTRRCVIVGEHDELYPPRSVAVLDPDVVHVVPGADHFMADRDEEVADIVARALEAR